MSLTENSDQVFLPGGCNRTQNLKFGPYTSRHILNKHFREWQSKMSNISTNVDPGSLETELSPAVCRPTCDKWQSKTQFSAICDPRSSIVESVFDCRLSDMIKESILCLLK